MKNFLFAAAVAATSTWLPACKTSQPAVTDVDHARGEVHLFSAGDPRSSLAEETKLADVHDIETKLKQHLQDHRDDVAGILSLAQVQVALRELDEAELNCHTALRHDLKNLEARKILAEIAVRRGNLDLASIFLTSAGGTASKDSEVLNMMAMVELGHGDNSSAMALFKQAIKLNSNDLAARMNLGVLMLKYRQLDQAAVEFERVLHAVPNHSDAKLHLAIIKSVRGQNEDAAQMLKEVLKSDDGNPLALYNLAVVERERAHYDEAEEALKGYLKSPRAKGADQEQVLALESDLQRRKSAKDGNVSDEQIQQMALSAKAAPQAGRAPADAPPPKAEDRAPEPSQPDGISDLERQLK